MEPGPALVSRLREALRDSPDAKRFVIGPNHPPSVAEGTVTAGSAVGVVAVPMRDTVKEVVDGTVRRTVPRETLVEVLGPWVFGREALADALTRVMGREAQIADMVGFCQAAHVHVRVLSVS